MKDDIILSTGNEVRCNHGIIGLGTNNDIYEGYDGDIFNENYMNVVRSKDILDEDIINCNLNKFELLELSDIMIKRWTDFKKYMELK